MAAMPYWPPMTRIIQNLMNMIGQYPSEGYGVLQTLEGKIDVITDGTAPAKRKRN